MFIPELTEYAQWVVTYIADKIPLNPVTGERAKSDDPATWTTYQVAKERCEANPNLTLGFVLTANDPFVCIDMDSHKTGSPAILANHKEIYERFNTWSELSPSGGVHIWLKASFEGGRRLSQQYLEVYSSGRYMTVTGKTLNAVPIELRQDELNELVQAIDVRQAAVSIIDSPEVQTDYEVCSIAANASNGDLFKALYQGQWKDVYPSQSEADIALVDIIAFYTDNRAQVARIFRSSELGKRKKAQRNDYLFHPKWGIVSRAFDQKGPKVSADGILKEIERKMLQQATVEANKPILRVSPSLPEFIAEPAIDFSFDQLPPGMVGEIAVFIYQNAFRPVKEIAVSAAIAYFAGICGKAFNVSHTGLNHYIAVLAPTAGGKEGAASGMERLTGYIREKLPAFDQFVGPSEIASPQALIKHLSTVSPCFISHKSEIGFWLQKLTSRFAKSNETTLRGLLLDLYTKSGNGQVVRGSIYSDKTKDVHPIPSPAFTLFGDATPDTFYKALDEENIEEGLIPRFTVVEASTAKVEYNENHSKVIPDSYLIDRLVGTVKRAMNLHQLQSVINVIETPEARREHLEFMQLCYNKALEDRDSAEGKLYSRAHLRLLRLAGLLAVGINPDNPVMTQECVRWAKGFIVQGIANVVARFNAGTIGAANYSVEQKILVGRTIRKYYEGKYRDSYLKSWDISEEMFKARIVTHRYIHSNSYKHACFRLDRNADLSFKTTIQQLIDTGVLVKVDMGKTKDSPRHGLAYYVLDVNGLARA